MGDGEFAGSDKDTRFEGVTGQVDVVVWHKSLQYASGSVCRTHLSCWCAATPGC